MKYKAYDLPCPDPVAEQMTYQEAIRFEDLGFLVLPQHVSLDTRHKRKKLRRMAKDVINRRVRSKASRRGLEARPA